MAGFEIKEGTANEVVNELKKYSTLCDDIVESVNGCTVLTELGFDNGEISTLLELSEVQKTTLEGLAKELTNYENSIVNEDMNQAEVLATNREEYEENENKGQEGIAPQSQEAKGEQVVETKVASSKEETPAETKKEPPKEEAPAETKKEPPKEEAPAETKKEPPKEEAPAETKKEPPKEEAPAETKKEPPKEEAPAETKKEPPKEEAPAETKKEPPKETPKTTTGSGNVTSRPKQSMSILKENSMIKTWSDGSKSYYFGGQDDFVNAYKTLLSDNDLEDFLLEVNTNLRLNGISDIELAKDYFKKLIIEKYNIGAY